VSGQRCGEHIVLALRHALGLGLEQGSLHSFICPTLDKYSVFGAHPSAVVGLLGAAEGILSVCSEYIRMHTRGGVSMLSFRSINRIALYYSIQYISDTAIETSSIILLAD